MRNTRTSNIGNQAPYHGWVWISSNVQPAYTQLPVSGAQTLVFHEASSNELKEGAWKAAGWSPQPKEIPEVHTIAYSYPQGGHCKCLLEKVNMNQHSVGACDADWQCKYPLRLWGRCRRQWTSGCIELDSNLFCRDCWSYSIATSLQKQIIFTLHCTESHRDVFLGLWSPLRGQDSSVHCTCLFVLTTAAALFAPSCCCPPLKKLSDENIWCRKPHKS